MSHMNMTNVKLLAAYEAAKLARKKAMRKLRTDKGWSYARIGRKYGLTRQRVAQILSK